MRIISFVPEAWDQYTHWQNQDRKTLKRINILIEVSIRDPFVGIGKPEGLLGNLSGYWSRRNDEANRLVYRAADEELVVIGS